MKNIRNFCIIAHIDHGKSTLADRMLELTDTLAERKMQEQVLDSMELERERGITIKSHPIRMQYQDNAGELWEFNLIDTPGHVDFSYEVSRSLAACEGAILVVDASQGVEAQTLANLYLAMESDLEILPVLNKIDLPGARTEEVREELAQLLGIEEEEIMAVSAKTGLGVEEVLEAVPRRLPGPKLNEDAPLRALIIDSQYDPYLGAVATVRVVDGKIRTGSRIRFLATGQDYEVQETGNFVLSRQKSPSLDSGQVGYLVSGAKQIRDLRVGDTVVDAGKDFPEALPGYKEVKPMVFSGLYPLDADSYEMLREALQKLQLNDSAIRYEPESSTALGFGFRVGFLGLLHMEIVQERLEREFSLGIIATLPNVEYQVSHKDGSELLVSNPAQMPEAGEISEIREPYVRSTVYTPADYVGPLMKLCMERRGIQEGMNYLDGKRVELHFRLPLSEVVVDFYDRLKNISRGHASFDYEYSGHEASELVKLVILINGSPVDALSAIVHRDQAHFWGDRLARKLKEQIPRQLFQVAIQASIGSRVVARCNVSALRKNVTAKCYGGDITRKRKLLERQKEGKRRMKQVGNVEIPQEAFLAVLKVER
ncbi:MAG: translation elongation factor 4 [Candidatus Krumholzibacteria bacterium]|jgi:GTP-binding protein LepA|nr:translation elongation factor 4 [Candidatus Krumholzibacteria bacterium]MDP6796984.1 translation elongation factor 4 [Candidatus Krumholzibacteria bacterium]MDP7022541.1 translation elongation factor 4 [Candidatus Krumholzibacteria bacterium]